MASIRPIHLIFSWANIPVLPVILSDVRQQLIERERQGLPELHTFASEMLSCLEASDLPPEKKNPIREELIRGQRHAEALARQAVEAGRPMLAFPMGATPPAQPASIRPEFTPPVWQPEPLPPQPATPPAGTLLAPDYNQSLEIEAWDGRDFTVRQDGHSYRVYALNFYTLLKAHLLKRVATAQNDTEKYKELRNGQRVLEKLAREYGEAHGFYINECLTEIAIETSYYADRLGVLGHLPQPLDPPAAAPRPEQAPLPSHTARAGAPTVGDPDAEWKGLLKAAAKGFTLANLDELLDKVREMNDEDSPKFKGGAFVGVMEALRERHYLEPSPNYTALARILVKRYGKDIASPATLVRGQPARPLRGKVQYYYTRTLAFLPAP